MRFVVESDLVEGGQRTIVQLSDGATWTLAAFRGSAGAEAAKQIVDLLNEHAVKDAPTPDLWNRPLARYVKPARHEL